MPISVDTYKPEVARAALAAGAHMLNDIYGFRRDASTRAHRRGGGRAGGRRCTTSAAASPATSSRACIEGLRESIAIARARGLPRERLIARPGVRLRLDGRSRTSRCCGGSASCARWGCRCSSARRASRRSARCSAARRVAGAPLRHGGHRRALDRRRRRHRARARRRGDEAGRRHGRRRDRARLAAARTP